MFKIGIPSFSRYLKPLNILFWLLCLNMLLLNQLNVTQCCHCHSCVLKLFLFLTMNSNTFILRGCIHISCYNALVSTIVSCVNSIDSAQHQLSSPTIEIIPLATPKVMPGNYMIPRDVPCHMELTSKLTHHHLHKIIFLYFLCFEIAVHFPDTSVDCGCLLHTRKATKSINVKYLYMFSLLIVS